PVLINAKYDDTVSQYPGGCFRFKHLRTESQKILHDRDEGVGLIKVNPMPGPFYFYRLDSGVS
ncbi:hypothetical protein ACSTJJ_22895, partial [Vibrio parahaemolyticus]